MAKRTLTAVIAVIAILAILLAMLAGCNKTSRERFEDERSSLYVVEETKGAKILEEKVISLLKEKDIKVQDSFIRARIVDGVPYINLFALVKNEKGAEMIKIYSVKSEYAAPIVSAFSFNADSISVSGKRLDIPFYLEYEVNYNLQGEEIVLT